MDDNTATVLVMLIIFGAPCVIAWLGIRAMSENKEDEE